jgi:hypothetical protein
MAILNSGLSALAIVKSKVNGDGINFFCGIDHPYFNVIKTANL